MNEDKIMKTILSGSDWETVLNEIVLQEDLDPWGIDISKLANLFVKYLEKAKDVSFKIPARFILVAAILLRMKCDLISLEEEEEEEEDQDEEEELLDVSNVPKLESPTVRKPQRKVMLGELVGALKKAFEKEERKKKRKFQIRHAVEDLIDFEVEDIDKRIEDIHSQVSNLFEKKDKVKFSHIVKSWTRNEIVFVLLPILHLAQDDKVLLTQEEMFGEIHIQPKTKINKKQ